MVVSKRIFPRGEIYPNTVHRDLEIKALGKPHYLWVRGAGNTVNRYNSRKSLYYCLILNKTAFYFYLHFLKSEVGGKRELKIKVGEA